MIIKKLYLIAICVAVIPIMVLFTKYGYTSSSSILEYNGNELYYEEKIDDDTYVYHLSPNTKLVNYDYYKMNNSNEITLVIETKDMEENYIPKDTTIFTTKGQVFIIKESRQ